MAPTAPTQAPVPLNATPGDGRVTLSWGTTPGATNYTLKRRDPYQSAYHDLTTLAASTHSYTDSGLTNGGVYYYEVVGVNGGGASPPAGPTQAVPRAAITVDALIRNAGDTTYDGNDRYNMVGTFQYKQQTMPANTAAVYNLKVQNDGTVATAIKVTGPAGGSGWSVHYYDALTGGNDITAQVTGTGWTTPSKLTAGAMRELRFSVTPSGSVAYGAIRDLLVRATAVADATKADVVKASTTLGQGIAKLQYSLDEGTTWQDVPQAGAAGYPLNVDQNSYVEFKAVKSNPNAAWPSGKPAWGGDGILDGDIGEITWAYFDTYSQNPTDLKVVTVECHNSVSAQVKVIPRYAISVGSDAPGILAGGTPANLATTTLWADVEDADGNVVPGATVNFSAQSADGTLAGQINNPGIADDSAVTDATGEAQVRLKSGSKLEDVTITATVTDPHGNIQDVAIVTAQPPHCTVTFGGWVAVGEGQQQQTVTITLTFGENDAPVVNFPVSLTKNVLDLATGNNAPLNYQNAAQLNAVTGNTGANGVFTTTLTWHPPTNDPNADPNGYDIYVDVAAPSITDPGHN